MSKPIAWREVAQRLAEQWAAAPEQVEPEVAAYLAGDGGADGVVLMACSGGADSVALALWAATYPALRARSMGLFYCDHGLRAEAAAEAAFVRELAGALGFDFYFGRAEGEGTPAGEQDLRELRENALRRVIVKLDAPVGCILTGHQADDVAENLLFRLARGSGLAGMSGLRPVQVRRGWPVRLRPLLRWRRAALRSALERAGGMWCEDRSNESLQYTRNRLRLEVLPALEAVFPDRSVAESLLACHRELRAVDRWVEERARVLLAAATSDDASLSRACLKENPLFVQTRVLEMFVRREAGGLEVPARTLEAVLAAGKAVVIQLSPAWKLSASAGAFQLLPGEAAGAPASPVPERVLGLSEDVFLPSGHRLRVEEVTLDRAAREAVLRGDFPPTTAVWLTMPACPLRVRGWQPGDRYRPLGAPGSRKLQDCFVDAGIEQTRRRSLPLVCDATGAILWVPGLPPAQTHRLEHTTTQALRLTYKKS